MPRATRPQGSLPRQATFSRRLPRAARRRARCVEAQLAEECERLFREHVRSKALRADHLHAVWVGFERVCQWQRAHVAQERLRHALSRDVVRVLGAGGLTAPARLTAVAPWSSGFLLQLLVP